MQSIIKSILLTTTLFLISMSIHAQEYGIASYYSDSFHGRSTASGESYNKTKFTGAHKTLEFGTIVRVTRLDNNASVKVRINDRGPYIKGRIIELSRKAANQLGIIQDGNAKVKVEVVGQGQMENASTSKPNKVILDQRSKASLPDVEEYSEEEAILKPIQKKNRIVEQPAIIERTKSANTTPPKKQTVVQPKVQQPKPKAVVIQQPVKTETKNTTTVKSTDDDTFTLVKSKDYKPYGVFKMELKRPKNQGFGVQVASMGSYENVMRQVASLQAKWFDNILMSIEKGKNGQPVYKVILGPFSDRESANAYKNRLKKNKNIGGFVVDLSQMGN